MYQKLVVVADWLGALSGAGMQWVARVPWSETVEYTVGGAANAARNKYFILVSRCGTSASAEAGPAEGDRRSFWYTLLIINVD